MNILPKMMFNITCIFNFRGSLYRFLKFSVAMYILSLCSLLCITSFCVDIFVKVLEMAMHSSGYETPVLHSSYSCDLDIGQTWLLTLLFYLKFSTIHCYVNGS